MNSSEFRKAAHAAVDQIIDYYETIADRRVSPNVEPGYLRDLLPDGPPEDPEPWESIQEDIEKKIIPGLTHWQSPNFFGFYPCTTSYPSMLGELYSSAFTCAAFNWISSPAITELETIVLDWLCKMLDLPDCYLSSSSTGGGGVIHGSASEAVLTVIVTARERYLSSVVSGDGEIREKLIAEKRNKLVALGSDQTHISTKKAALVAGVKYVAVETDESFRLLGSQLRKEIVRLKQSGLEPFYLTCTLGTTTTCAIDEFEEIAKVAKEFPDIWIHVDAAYAGAALICPEYRQTAATANGVFEHFDSFNFNMHKWLVVNFDASCLFVKRRKPLLDAMSLTPPYLRNPFSDNSNKYQSNRQSNGETGIGGGGGGGESGARGDRGQSLGQVIDYRNWQIPLGRRFRAVKIWFVLRTFGTAGLRAHIRKTVELGNLFTSLLESRKDLFEIVTEPRFGLNVFRIVKVPPSSLKKSRNGQENEGTGGQEGMQGEEEKEREIELLEKTNELTKRIYEKINSEGKIFLTSTTLPLKRTEKGYHNSGNGDTDAEGQEEEEEHQIQQEDKDKEGKNTLYVMRVVNGNLQIEETYFRRAFEVIVQAAEEVITNVP